MSGAANADLPIVSSIAHEIMGVILPAVPLMVLAVIGGVLVLVIRLIRKRNLRLRRPTRLADQSAARKRTVPR